jgi:hypothetical protein
VSFCVAGQLVDARGVMISVPTVPKRLKERGLSAKTPPTGPRLTVEHRREEIVRRRDKDQGSDTVNAAYLPELDIMEAV